MRRRIRSVREVTATDSILIFPPGPSVAGSQLQLGTYLMWDPGADYGAKGLIQSLESSNALRDGGAFAYRNVGPRKMAFPLLLRDVPGQTMLQTESLLRTWTTAGAAVAVQPETVPSGQAVFFDVIDGRWEPDYDGFLNRAGRRKGTLYLDTQPWGYWPTEMLLASAASIGYMGRLAVNGASVIGDVPPLARIQIIPSSASTFLTSAIGGGGSQVGLDMVAISLGAQPSFAAFIPPASFFPQRIGFSASPGGVGTGVLSADQFAPASQGIFWSATAAIAGGAPGWNLAAYAQIPSALEPAYRGRFRAFAFLKFAPAAAATVTFSAILDAERSGFPSSMAALASGNQLATLGGASNIVNSFFVASNAYHTLDMGEITLPAGGGSGLQEAMRLRLWLNATTATAYAATVGFGGLYLLPVDGAGGVLTRGGVVPTLSGNPIVGLATQAGFEWNTRFGEETYFVNTQPGLAAVGAQPQVYADARAFYRGVAPRVGATTNQLTFLTSDRIANNFAVTQQAYQGSVEYSKVSVSYRPTFQFLYGL
jgi:hypothetical protein